MDDPSLTTSLRPRGKFLIGGAIVAVALLGLVAWAMARPGSTSFYLSTSELARLGATETGQSYRVNGKVVPGSLERDGLASTFALTDGNTEVVVSTDTPLPDTFKDRSDVVARGVYDGKTFTADQVLAKCPSKFKAKS
jgi:cytochrome c-type biogenesis protein CcmE